MPSAWRAQPWRCSPRSVGWASGWTCPCPFGSGCRPGDAVAGVIGRQKFVYDLWGDTVNTASRMETHGVGGHIQVHGARLPAAERPFTFTPRGEIEIKGKGSMPTFFLVGAR